MKYIKYIALVLLVLLSFSVGWYMRGDTKIVETEEVVGEKQANDLSLLQEVSDVPKEIVWQKYENDEVGIRFYFPPSSSVSESVYNGETGAVAYANVYDSEEKLSIFNSRLESGACVKQGGPVPTSVMVASSTFQYWSETYDNTVYDRYYTNRSGGCYYLNTIYYKNNPKSKEMTDNILKSFEFMR